MKTATQATDAQINYVRDLLKKKNADPALVAETNNALDTGLTSIAASLLIDRLKKAPWAPRTVNVTGQSTNPFAALDAALANLPAGYYAIKADDLRGALTETNLDSVADLYVRIDAGTGRWKGKKFIKRLHGNPGGFRSTRIALADALTVAKTIGRDPYAATRRFGEKYACCGKCLAPLTDEESVRLFLGPICRKAHGF